MKATKKSIEPPVEEGTVIEYEEVSTYKSPFDFVPKRICRFLFLFLIFVVEGFFTAVTLIMLSGHYDVFFPHIPLCYNGASYWLTDEILLIILWGIAFIISFTFDHYSIIKENEKLDQEKTKTVIIHLETILFFMATLFNMLNMILLITSPQVCHNSAKDFSDTLMILVMCIPLSAFAIRAGAYFYERNKAYFALKKTIKVPKKTS